MSGITITANDVVKIIKACKGSGVRYIHYDNLELKFDTENHPNKTKSNASHMDVASDGSTGHPPALALPDQQELTYRDEDYLIAEQADQLAIEDPAEFEQMQLKLMNRG